MDDFGHRIADEVLEPYLQFFIDAPSDLEHLLKENQQLQNDIKQIEQRADAVWDENRRLRDEVTKYRELARWIKAEAPTKYSRIADLIINQKSACTCAISNVASLHCPVHGLDRQSAQGHNE